MTTLIYWFRNDLRLADNPAFTLACKNATRLLPIVCQDPEANADTRWGFSRVGIHRQHFHATALADLQAQLADRGSTLMVLPGKAQHTLPALARQIGASGVLCEAIAAPEEQAEISALNTALSEDNIAVDAVWQSSMLEPAALPFTLERLPDMFTAFRHAIEKAGVLPHAPLPAPAAVPALPDLALPSPGGLDLRLDLPLEMADDRSSFPYWLPAFSGGERAAATHVARYFERKLAHAYKDTRNGLSGIDYSSKFSPWLATGALSARTACAALHRFESDHGANDGSYWLWFELLWRDYFRFLHIKYGARLYRAHGLADASISPPRHHSASFQRWRDGATGEPIVDAGMRELAATGYLSNRLRQIVASYLIHDLACDWRAGAAWFESQLIDYDPCSNQGNWLYIAGRGTDPRGGRRFNPHKQAQDYDPDGHYRTLWSQA